MHHQDRGQDVAQSLNPTLQGVAPWPHPRRQKADQHQRISPINEEIEEEMVLLEEDPGEDHLVGGAMCPSWKIWVNGKDDIPYIWWKIKMFQSTNQSHMRHHSRTWRSDDRWWCKVDLPRPPRTLVDPEILPESQFLLRNNHCGTISLLSYAHLYSWIISLWSQFLVLGVKTPFWMWQTILLLAYPTSQKESA